MDPAEMDDVGFMVDIEDMIEAECRRVAFDDDARVLRYFMDTIQKIEDPPNKVRSVPGFARL